MGKRTLTNLWLLWPIIDVILPVTITGFSVFVRSRIRNMWAEAGVIMSESVPMTPIRFTLTKELVVKAATLAASRYYIRFLWFALIVGMLTSAFVLLNRPKPNLERELLATFLIIMSTLTIAMLMIGLMRYLIYPFYARRNFQQQKALTEEMSLSWTDEVFIYTSGKSKSEMPFANLHGYRASSEIIILYLADAIYHMVPIEAFGGTEQLGSFMLKLQQASVKQL
jgi:hypothetical protein